MTDRSVSSASFYEPPFQYKEENTMLLYQNIKMVRGYIYNKNIYIYICIYNCFIIFIISFL